MAEPEITYYGPIFFFQIFGTKNEKEKEKRNHCVMCTQSGETENFSLFFF